MTVIECIWRRGEIIVAVEKAFGGGRNFVTKSEGRYHRYAADESEFSGFSHLPLVEQMEWDQSVSEVMSQIGA